MEQIFSKPFINMKKNNYGKILSSLLLLFQIMGLFLATIFHEELSNMTLYLSIGFIFSTAIMNFVSRKYLKGDHTFIFLVNLLYSISVIMILRLNPGQANRHIIWYITGSLLFIVVYYLMKYLDRFLKDKFILFFAITLITFILTLALGYSSGGAKNWIRIGSFFSLQLSEFAKISFVFMIASYYENYDKYINKKFGKYYLVIATYIFCGLFFIQTELGTAIIFFGLLIASMFIFERRTLFVLGNIALALIGVYLASLVLPHIKIRIEMWLNPWSDFNKKGYQIIQSLYAIASGGFFGTGIGMGSPELVPVVESDFILTGIIEEMGMFIGFSIILIFILIFYKTIKMSLEFKSNYMSSIALSIGIIFALQSLIMFGGILKLIPLTGITTPFLSYGGSSTMSSFILLAILQYLSTKTGDFYESV